MFNFVLWSVVVGLTPVAAALLRTLIFSFLELVSSIFGSDRQVQANEAFTCAIDGDLCAKRSTAILRRTHLGVNAGSSR